MKERYMANKLTHQQFATAAITVHGNRYDYSKVNYIGTHKKVEIVCAIHGSFLVTPNSHVSKKSGCPSCAKKRYMTLELFIQRAKDVHGELYDYSSVVEYCSFNKPVTITCKRHGPFSQTPRGHLLGKQGCPSCARASAGLKMRLSPDTFLMKAQQVHQNRYDYSKVHYINGSTKVEIICNRHGSFLQRPENHVNLKQGCPKCARERLNKGIGGYTLGWFDCHPEYRELPAIFYVIEMFCETDHFFKVGITKNDIKKRYSRAKQGDKYIKKIVLLTKELPLFEAFKLEQQVLEELASWKYFPNYVFEGRTECLKAKPEVLHYIIDAVYKK